MPAVRTGAVYAALFLMIGVMLPFLPVWLAARGFSVEAIALTLAAQSLTRVAVTPAVTYLADRAQARRRFIVACCVVAAVFSLAAAVADGVVPIAVFLVVSAAGWAPVIPMLDAVAVAQSDEGHYDYGVVRTAGSIAFIAGSVGAGAMLGRIGPDDVIWIIVGATFMLAISSLALPKLGASPAAEQLPAVTLLTARRTLATGGFLIVVLAAGLTQASHALYYGFGSLHWSALGYTGTLIGVLWAIGVVAEIVLFLFARNAVGKFGATRLLAIGAALAALRWCAMALDPPLAVVIALQCLHAASFAATHLAVVYWIRRHLDVHHAGVAQGVFTAISGGSLMTAAMWISGPVYAAFGGSGYLAMAVLAMTGLGLALLLPRYAPLRREA